VRDVSRTNVVVFMTDHQRWDTIFPYSRAKTPHINALAEKSTVFTRAYCPSPHCCPSRASFFSGLYPSEHGVWNNVDVGNALSHGLNEGIRLFPEMLQEHGYHCYLSGKWHVSAEEGPLDKGFDDCFNFGIRYDKRKNIPDDREWDLYYRNNRWEKIVSGEDVRQDGQVLRVGYPVYTQYGNSSNPFGDVTTVDHAVRHMESCRDAEKPVFIFTGVSGPHDPYCVPDEFEKMYSMEDMVLPDSFEDDMADKPNLYRRMKGVYASLTEEEHRKSMLKYLAFCSFEDHLFQRVFEASQMLRGRTLFLYLSDHGDYMADHGLWAKGLPCFDGAYHIPLVIHDSERETGAIVDHFVSLTDIAPTILDYCSIPYPAGFSGKSLRPLVQGSCMADIRDSVFTQSNGNELYGIQRSVRNRKYKLVYNGFDFDEFYDLEKDPTERRNVFEEPAYADAIREMYAKLWNHAFRHKDNCINPYIMVGLSRYGPGVIFNRHDKALSVLFIDSS